MIRSRPSLVLAILTVIPLNMAFSQIEVVDPASRDLKRTAHKLRMTSANLGQR